MDISHAGTLFSRTLLLGGMLFAASAAHAAPIDAGSLFTSSHRHIAYGAEVRTLRDETRVSDGRFAGRRSSGFTGLAPRGEVAVPEPGAALLFGLGALVVARRRRRA